MFRTKISKFLISKDFFSYLDEIYHLVSTTDSHYEQTCILHAARRQQRLLHSTFCGKTNSTTTTHQGGRGGSIHYYKSLCLIRSGRLHWMWCRPSFFTQQIHDFLKSHCRHWLTGRCYIIILVIMQTIALPTYTLYPLRVG